MEALCLNHWTTREVHLIGTSFFFYYYYYYLILFIFVFIWLHWVSIAACQLSLVAERGGYSSMQCLGFLLRWLLLLLSVGSRARVLSSCSSWALEHRIDSWGPQAELLQGMWGLPRSGIEPTSPALAGRLFTPKPRGKPWNTLEWRLLTYPVWFLLWQARPANQRVTL